MSSVCHWVIADGAPVRVEPMKGSVLTRLVKYSKVDVLDEAQAVVQGRLTPFVQVRYAESNKAETVGWVYAGYLEPYINPFRRDVVKVRNATVNPNDAAWWMFITHMAISVKPMNGSKWWRAAACLMA